MITCFSIALRSLSPVASPLSLETDLKSPCLYLLFAALALSSACASQPATSPGASPDAFDLSWLAERPVHEPRVVLDAEGSMLLVWRQKTAAGSDLFLARRNADGTFADPMRVNDEPDTVASFPHDELRPAVAVGGAGRVAIAWGDARGQVRAALSRDGGATFSPSLRLEQVDAPAYRGFPAIAFDAAGTLQAVWIDSRHAQDMAEEPADLFHASVADGVVTERNLTADQEATVCGCCRPDIEVAADGTLSAVFRNADDGGYRDIFLVRGPATKLPAPRRIGRPLWKLQGCPMSGPMIAGERVLWPDGSSGRKLLRQATIDGTEAPLFSDEARGGWRARLAPRRIASAGTARVLVLLPGQVDSRLIVLGAGAPEIVADDLPAWASDAAYDGQVLRLVGAVDGVVQFASRPLAL
jgi:hypothetical protein